MTWGLLLLLAFIVFVNRYVFLEPKMPVRLPALFNEALTYSAPCLLTAICGPIIMGSTGLAGLPSNPYVYGALVSVVLAYKIKRMVVAVLLSLILFYVIYYVMS
ncbi:AzlD domain-containing protein [Neisseriaceae bacterium CLB008]|nr:AzlD domain-containing protein [Neisseriaceae bacterium]